MIKVYSTWPRPAGMSARDYVAATRNVAAWSERAGLCGMLVHADDDQVDPWLLAQVVIEGSERLRPLVAVRPERLHPYTMAKTVSSLAFLYGRPVHLDMLAGGIRGEPLGAGGAPHDRRFARIVEYVNLAMALMRGERVTSTGEYYSVTKLRLTPAVPDALLPEIIVSGSSPAAMAAARAIGATAVKRPAPPGAEQTWLDATDRRFGVRIGIVARADPDEAWRIARERFPEHRSERIGRPATRTGKPDGYWLDPFHYNQAPCPYLVGTYEDVAQMIAHYVVLGSRTFILDVPPSEDELAHVNLVFGAARELAVA